MPFMFLARLLVAAAAVSSSMNAAYSASSETHATDGATLRLVTSGLADETGRLRGALEIRLAPGWKTYWKEPGASGVPPQIDLGDSINVSAAVFHFPAPQWHEDKYGAWAGYGEPVVLPITFTVDEPARFSVIEADLFLGICETMCIPVQARLSVEPGSAPGDPHDAAIVDAAFAALPQPSGAGFGVTEATRSGDVLRLTAATPAAATGEPALFLASDGTYVFGVPKVVGGGGEATTFEVPVLAGPANGAASVEVSYTLTAGNAAATGTFVLP